MVDNGRVDWRKELVSDLWLLVILLVFWISFLSIIQFPLAAHDDGPDALAGAVSLLLAQTKARRPVLIPRAR